jgi:electron transfer flavoprotein alpha subunit
MNIEEQINQWVSIDNQLKRINDQTKKLREHKQKLTENIIMYHTNNNLINKPIQISDGKIQIVTNKSTQNITFKYLESCLKEIIKNETQIHQIIQYIKNKREIKNTFEIKRFYND